MTFLHPEFLYYMLPLVLILFFFLLTQKEPQASYFSDEVIKKLKVSSNNLSLKARNVFFMIIAILMIIALAAPVIKDGKVEVKAKSADIMIALDISDSMLATDVYPSRLKLAKQKALELLRLAPNERIGVIAFAKNSYLVSPLSFDHEAVEFLLGKLDTTSITEQGTNLMSMLETVDKSIKKDSKKYILIFSDGGDSKDFSKEISFAKEKGIVVFVLGMGTKQGAPIKMRNGEFIKQNGKIIISKLNESISALATKTGGVYIQNVNSNKDVKKMLQEIENNTKKKELKSQEIEKFIPLFYFPLALALFLLLIATSSMSKRVKIDVPAAFILGLFLINSTSSYAGVLDFMNIKEAKIAYEHKEYDKSTKLYDAYAKSTKNGQGYYNAGNSLYKQGKYKEAIQNYEEAKFNEKSSRAKNLANIGNAYAKMGQEKNLKKAIESYESSLKIKEDKDTRENLEAVKKALQKKKKQNKKNNKSQKDQKNKKKQNKKNQDKKNKDNKSKNQDKKKQDSKGKGDKSDKKQDMKSKKPSQEERKKQEASQKDKKEKSVQKKEEKKKEESKPQKSKELKEQKKDDKSQKGISKQAMPIKDKMSDAEEVKWLKKLNKTQHTYLYKLNTSKFNKEDTNEKPW
ncbi:VWA domain-containing protein [Sulfurimonas sp.]